MLIVTFFLYFFNTIHKIFIIFHLPIVNLPIQFINCNERYTRKEILMLATVASVSSADRLKRHLGAKYSVSAKIIQTPSSLSKEGCGYSIRFDDAHKSAVVRSAAALKINIRAFYREDFSSSPIRYIKD